MFTMKACLVFVLYVLVCQPIEVRLEQTLKKHAEIKMGFGTEELKFSYDEKADDGPSKWAKTYPNCNGTMQSPINLDLGRLQLTKIPKINWSSEYKTVPQKMELYVFNHVLLLTPDYALGKVPTISGGPLNSTYALSDIAFHWGSKDGRGSLHDTGNGMFYDMEIHVVFMNQKYKTVPELLSHEDAVVSVTYLAENREKGNPLFDTILDNFPNINQVGTKVSMMQPFSLDKLLPELGDIMIYYKGSVPRPPCSEVVTWIFSPDSPQISDSQLASFRKLYRVDSKLIDNLRPIQPTNGRKVYLSE